MRTLILVAALAIPMPAQLTVTQVVGVPICTVAGAAEIVPGTWSTRITVYCASVHEIAVIALSFGYDPNVPGPCPVIVDFSQLILVAAATLQPPLGPWVYKLDVPANLGPVTWYAQAATYDIFTGSVYCTPEAWEFELL